MADQIRVTRERESVTEPRAERGVGFRPDPALQTQVRMPSDPEAARAEIEMTRTRMSETIDEIEDALMRRKAKFQDRLDVLGPVRERPMPSAGVALGAGLLLGLLTGGRGSSSEVTIHDADDPDWRRRADTWEHRARRLRDVAREQRQDIRALQEEWGEERARSLDGHHPDMSDQDRSKLRGVGATLAGGLAGFLTRTATEMIRDRSRRR